MPWREITVTEKTCGACKQTKSRDSFGRKSRNQDGLNNKCKDCLREGHNSYQAKWKKRNRESVAKYRLKWEMKNRFGMSVDEWERMLSGSGGRCEICGSPNAAKDGRRLSVDHCHATGKIRGLLCGNCNHVLGNAKDSTEILSKCIEYLRRHSEETNATIYHSDDAVAE